MAKRGGWHYEGHLDDSVVVVFPANTKPETPVVYCLNQDFVKISGIFSNLILLILIESWFRQREILLKLITNFNLTLLLP